MDSEDSRPGSSASNTSSNSSHNSRQSPLYNDGDEKQESPLQNSVASPASSSRSRQSQRSGSLSEGSRHSRSKSKSDSESSSNTSLSDDDAKSSNSTNHAKVSASVSSESGKINDSKRNLSTSPSRRSSRDSSSSSNRSRDHSEEPQQINSKVNTTHEDLSDVSDLESEKRTSVYNNSKHSVDDESTNEAEGLGTLGNNEFEEENSYLEKNEQEGSPITDLRQKLEKKKFQVNDAKNSGSSPNEVEDKTTNGKEKVEESLEDLVKTHDEDALDFEAEEGECHEVSKDDEKRELERGNDNKEENVKSEKNDIEEGEELEEGEVSDEDEKRPEETEPKPICRFYTRGQCTWGMSCRFLHPGVTDKGNYTMFDLVRPVPLPPSGNVAGNRTVNYPLHAADYHDYRTERPSLHHRTAALHHTASTYPANHETRKIALDGPVVVESAWERGLRTAKEMMRKANKRKEQDMDFEDKKMNLTLSPDELEKDPYYLKDRLSPADNVRHPLYSEATSDVYSATDRYGRGPPVSHYDEVDPYGRSTRYRELPPHRMPQYEDERRVRPAREVIVQRVEPVGRGDEWSDPWMRSKSPSGRAGSRDRGEKRRRERRSYSSNSSYSSSSSSQSDSTSDSSRSLSPRDHHRRRYNSSSHKTPPPSSHRLGGVRSRRSPTPPPRRSRRSPSLRQSPNLKRRINISTSPVYNRGNAYSPVHKRKRLSPVTKKMHNDKGKIKRKHSSSSSDSGSSASDSESDSGSSSSESSSRSRDHTPPKRLRASEKLSSNERKGSKNDPPKKRSPITIELKKPTTVGVSALTSPSHTASEKDSKKSRREELLKQLRAVEDAIAKKRSKLA